MQTLLVDFCVYNGIITTDCHKQSVVFKLYERGI